MKGLARCLPCLLALTLAPQGRAAPQAFALDPERSFVWFEVLHFGTSTLRGRFGPIDGAVELDREAGRGRLALTIDLRTVDTGVRVLDRRLMAPDLLAAEAAPEASFVAERFRFDGPSLAEVRGEFWLRGVSQPLSLRAERFGCRPGPAPWAETCGGDFSAEILRSTVGATFGLPFVADEVRLQVQVEGRRP